MPEALVAGLFAAGTALLFRAALDHAEALRDALTAGACRAASPALICLYPLLAGLIAALIVAATRRYAPEAAGSGIPHVKRTMHGFATFRHGRLLATKFVGATLGIGSGLALGREGPTIQMGAATADAVAARFGLSAEGRRFLVAAGAAAGLSAAFNAPLAGIMFVLEELRHDFNEFCFLSAITASVVADVLCRAAYGQQPIFLLPDTVEKPLAWLPVFHTTVDIAPPLGWLPAFALLGAACGLVGAAFNRALLAGLDRYGDSPSLLPAFLVGLLSGTVALAFPYLSGTASPFVAVVLGGKVAVVAAFACLALRFALTVLSYGIGAPGGIFAPLLVLGSLTGAALAGTLAAFVDCPPMLGISFTAVGMGAMFVAIVRAPLTGILLIAEMTGGDKLLLPLLVACLAAYFTAEALRSLPVYDALARRAARGERKAGRGDAAAPAGNPA